MRIVALLISFILAASTASANSNETILGAWTTAEAKSQVEIYRCGEKICGKIVSLKEPRYTDSKDGPIGALKLDSNNPDQTLRQRPIAGLQIMDGFTPDGNGGWENGTIYDPENGKRYRCKMRLASSNRLEVRGFIGISLLGRTTVWTR